VLGLVGTNGIGKSTALKVLSGKLKPNLGEENAPDWETVVRHFRGSELQNYFTKLLEDGLQAVIKPQYVDQLPKAIRGSDRTVGALIEKQSQPDDDYVNQVLDVLDLKHLLDREIQQLSGGELQRFAIGITCVQHKDIYLFDEPSSYLDVKQRLNAARIIRSVHSFSIRVLAVVNMGECPFLVVALSRPDSLPGGTPRALSPRPRLTCA